MRQRAASSQLFLFWVVLFGAVGVRFFFLQHVSADFFKNLAQSQYWVEKPHRQGRGTITDRFGDPLVLNQLRPSLFIDPSFVADQSALNYVVAAEYPEINIPSGSKFVWLERMISDEKLAHIKSYGCKDIHVCFEPDRYLCLAQAQNVVGSTDIDGIGISGLEKQYDGNLASIPGTVRFQKDARRGGQKYVTSQILDAGTPGKNIQLTISKPLQHAVAREVDASLAKWQAKEVSALVLDPVTGQILSAVGMYNDHGNGKDRLGPMCDCYEFGSVMKIFVTLAALDEGVVTFDEMIDCGGDEQEVGGFMVRNWTPLENLTFLEAFQKSSNVALAKVACRVGKPLYDHLCRLGFGQKTGVDFPGERKGFVNPPKKWSRSSLQALSFGYEMNGTLLQLACAMGVIVADGIKQSPHFVIDQTKNKMTPEIVYCQNSLKLIQEAISGADSRYGLGSQLQKIPGLQVLGKTGTARCLVDGEYCVDKHLYTFVGGIKKDGYARVIVTFLSQAQGHDLYASQTAAPLFYSIARQVVMQDLVHGIL